MTYTVIFQNTAIASLEAIYDYVAQDDPAVAKSYVSGLNKKSQTLKALPNRCPLAPENGTGGLEIRHLLYDRYRVIFTVVDHTVHVLDIRHGARLSDSVRSKP